MSHTRRRLCNHTVLALARDHPTTSPGDDIVVYICKTPNCNTYIHVPKAHVQPTIKGEPPS